MLSLQVFHAELAAAAAGAPGPELLPQRLATACARALPVDGAGMSLFFSSGRRVPLGASDDISGFAERLQFTTGEGPCLTAHAEERPVVADEDVLARRWPAFFADLVAQTPFRAIVSVPLEDSLRGFGALDLYLVPPRVVGDVGLADAVAVTDAVTRVFRRENDSVQRRSDGPAWLDAPAAQRRSLVWQAMGYLTVTTGLSGPDALALLRAHAYGLGSDVDTLARQVLDRTVPVDDLAPGTDAL